MTAIVSWFEDGYGTSMRALEVRTITESEGKLQIAVLKDMVLNTTNPSVSAIAQQSMPSLHLLPADGKEYLQKDSDVLIEKLREEFREFFPESESESPSPSRI